MRNKAISKYTFSELIKTVYSFVMTKLFMRQAKLVRRPVYIRGKRSIAGCSGLTTGRFCRFDLDGGKITLNIGDNCSFGDNTHIVALKDVKIGNNVLIASKVFISDTSHGAYKGEMISDPKEAPANRQLISSYVHIGDNVWIGDNVSVLPGVELGNGCVVGANSVVTKSFPENCVLAGVPAKIIRIYGDNNG